MPTPIILEDTLIPTYQAVWSIDNFKPNTESTGSMLLDQQGDSNTFYNHSFIDLSEDNTIHNLREFKVNNKYIQFEYSFKKQLSDLTEFYDNMDLSFVKEKFDVSINSLLDLEPDTISMELTSEKSIFYTVKKSAYTFFLQHFIYEIEDEDSEEFLLSVYKGDRKLPSHAGNISQTIFEIYNILS